MRGNSLRKIKTKTPEALEKMLQKIIVVDVETAGKSARPESFVFGCAYGYNLRKVFTSHKEMAAWCLSRQNRGCFIFAHNAEYDFTCLFDNILTKLDSQAIFVGSLFIIAKKNGVTFFNSLAVLKSSVDELGKNLGKAKGKLHDKFKVDLDPNDKKKIVAYVNGLKITKEDTDYCFRDCEIIYDYLLQMYQKTEKIKPTVASCAMEIFSKKYLKREIFIHPLNENFRESYYGGRVECFRMGYVNGYKYDINSLYPFVCTDMFFPDFENLKHIFRTSVNKLKTLLKTHEGNADVNITFNNNFIGCLPYRRRAKNGNVIETIFPVGSFNGTYNFNELRNVIKLGGRINSVCNITYGERIRFDSLRDYMLDFYKLKNETTGGEKLLNKFLLNSLTGKFAERTHTKMIYFEDFESFASVEKTFEKQDFDMKHFSKERNDFFICVQQQFVKKNWLIPTISSYITSESRVRMCYYYFKYAKTLLYTDTDSLVVSKPIEKKDIGFKLGQLKKEEDTITEIKGNKYYHSKKGKEKIIYLKGIPKEHFNTGKRFTFKRMLRTKEAMRRNMDAGIFIEVSKNLKGDYTKRIINKDGSTKPLTLKEK